MSQGTLHFTIDLEWLTQHIRQVWSEGKYENAFGLLESSGCPVEYHADIIRGKLKLIGDETGGDIDIDNWEPDLQMCHRGTYPDPDELAKIATDGEQYKHLYYELLRRDYFELCYRWDRLADGDRLADLAWLFRQFPDEFIETLDPIERTPYNLSCRYNLVQSSATAMGGYNTGLQIPSVEEYVSRQVVLDRTPAPEQDDTFSANFGWLLPDGRFYPCEYWEHDWLANVLGKSVQEAEGLGWIRIGYSKIVQEVSIMRQDDTQIPQRQLDSLWDWCTVHNVPLPDFAIQE